MVSRCDACGQPIVWATTERGRRIPLDPEPRPDGNVELICVHGVDVARVVTAVREQELEQQAVAAIRAGREPELRLHMSHFATCPSADTFRRRARADAQGGTA